MNTAQAHVGPVFVNRREQLDRFASVIAGLRSVGRGRHLALLGLRQIGKSTLLGEVRRRHAGVCIPMLSLDTMATTPRDLALEWLREVLLTASAVQDRPRVVTTSTRSIAAAAALLGEGVLAHADEILDLIERPDSNGLLLSKLFLFPHAVSAAIDGPVLVVLDEFQDIRKIARFPDTENLWGALREALDRVGRVAFVVSGSVVTAMRTILDDHTNPLFARFEQMDLPPFGPEDTGELVTALWARADAAWDDDAAFRVQGLTHGFPLYTTLVANAAADTARLHGQPITPEMVDAGYQDLLLRPRSPLGIYLEYVYTQAVGGSSVRAAVVRHLAGAEGRRQADLVRAVGRQHGQGQIAATIRDLRAIDVVVEKEGGLYFTDPLLPIWIKLEVERRDAGVVFSDAAVRERVMETTKERLRAVQTTLGDVFEDVVRSIARRFDGRTIAGTLLGTPNDVVLPRAQSVSAIQIPDRTGEVLKAPGTVEIDALVTGDRTWLVEAKHRLGGATLTMVNHFDATSRFAARELGLDVDRRWFVSGTGFRGDARARLAELGILASNKGQLARIEQALR